MQLPPLSMVSREYGEVCLIFPNANTHCGAEKQYENSKSIRLASVLLPSSRLDISNAGHSIDEIPLQKECSQGTLNNKLTLRL